MSIIRQPLKPSSQVLSNRESLLVARKPFLNCVGPSTNQYSGDRSVDLKKLSSKKLTEDGTWKPDARLWGHLTGNLGKKNLLPFFQLLGPI